MTTSSSFIDWIMTPRKRTRYTLPLDFLLRAGLSVLLGRPRSFQKDASWLLARRGTSLKVTGAAHISPEEKYIFTINHYTRTHFNVWWAALVISALTGQDISWIMTSRWNFEGKWYAGFLQKVTRWLFARLAHMYGLITTPPVPVCDEDAAERGASVRKVLSLARDGNITAFGLIPEGRDFGNGQLAWPPYAAGRFVYHLNRMGYRILPVGLYEEEGQIVVHFGRPYDLGEPHSHASGDVDLTTFRLLTRRQTDLLLTRTVMLRIAVLLPEAMRGEFR